MYPVVHAGQTPPVPAPAQAPPFSGVQVMEAGTFIAVPAIFAGVIWGLRGAVWGGLVGAGLFGLAYWAETSAIGMLFGTLTAAQPAAANTLPPAP